MLITGISQLDAPTSFGGRSPTTRSRRPAEARAAAPVEPPDDPPADGDDRLDPESEQGMTLAAAQAAYASS